MWKLCKAGVKGVSVAPELFSDELITATDLNRHTGRILDLALERPVTITRNEDHFALVKREDAARFIAGARNVVELVEALQTVYAILTKGPVDPASPYSWLTGFKPSELREFTEEILAVFRLANKGERPWSEFRAVLHEWEESAAVLASDAVREAFESAADEVPITMPVSSKEETL